MREPAHQAEAQVDQARNIALPDVLQGLGARRDRYDRAKWRIDGKIISVTGSLFYDHAGEQGGRGAIDLVMYVRGDSFREALDYLGTPTFGQEARTLSPISDEPSRERGPFRPPAAVPVHWRQVRAYLVEDRRLPGALVDELHCQGLIYADERRNAVFLRRDEDGQATGAMLRGTAPGSTFKGLATGTERERGWFHFAVGDRGVPQLVLAESAIDALSYYGLVHGDCPPVGSGAYREVYASTDGAGALPHALLQRALEDGGLVRVAFDRDERGEAFWQALQERFGGNSLMLWREAPGSGKDWNDLLRARDGEREQAVLDR
jgi:hypothetical protein